MSRHDWIIQNQPGLAVRLDIQDALKALASNSSGAGLPTANTEPYQFAIDEIQSPPALAIRNGANSDWILLGAVTSNFGLAPIGSIVMWPGGSIPDKYLECNGQEVNRSVYAALFAVLGTTHGAGNGSTTFNLPDFRRRSPVGSDTSGTRNRGATGGAETVTLTIAQLPSHSHTASTSTYDHSHTLTTNARYETLYGTGQNALVRSTTPGTITPTTTQVTADTDHHSHTVTINSTGSGEVINTMNPWIAMPFIIRAQ